MQSNNKCRITSIRITYSGASENTLMEIFQIFPALIPCSDFSDARGTTHIVELEVVTAAFLAIPPMTGQVSKWCVDNRNSIAIPIVKLVFYVTWGGHDHTYKQNIHTLTYNINGSRLHLTKL